MKAANPDFSAHWVALSRRFTVGLKFPITSYSKNMIRCESNTPPDIICEKLIRYRGDAHCRERGNVTTRKALSDAPSLCASLGKNATRTIRTKRNNRQQKTALHGCRLPSSDDQLAKRTVLGHKNPLQENHRNGAVARQWQWWSVPIYQLQLHQDQAGWQMGPLEVSRLLQRMRRRLDKVP